MGPSVSVLAFLGSCCCTATCCRWDLCFNLSSAGSTVECFSAVTDRVQDLEWGISSSLPPCSTTGACDKSAVQPLRASEVPCDRPEMPG